LYCFNNGFRLNTCIVTQLVGLRPIANGGNSAEISGVITGCVKAERGSE